MCLKVKNSVLEEFIVSIHHKDSKFGLFQNAKYPVRLTDSTN